MALRNANPTRKKRLLRLKPILYGLEWQGLDVSAFVQKIPATTSRAERQMRRIRLADSGEERIIDEAAGASSETFVCDPSCAARMISDIVPNAWWARGIVGDVLTGLKAAGFGNKKLGELSGLIVEELRKWIEGTRDKKAESLFRSEVAAGRIQFRLRTDTHNWRMPFQTETYEPATAEKLAVEKSLLHPICRGDFSSQDEREIAVYLDGEGALK